MVNNLANYLRMWNFTFVSYVHFSNLERQIVHFWARMSASSCLSSSLVRESWGSSCLHGAGVGGKKVGCSCVSGSWISLRLKIVYTFSTVSSSLKRASELKRFSFGSKSSFNFYSPSFLFESFENISFSPFRNSIFKVGTSCVTFPPFYLFGNIFYFLSLGPSVVNENAELRVAVILPVFPPLCPNSLPFSPLTFPVPHYAPVVDTRV